MDLHHSLRKIGMKIKEVGMLVYLGDRQIYHGLALSILMEVKAGVTLILVETGFVNWHNIVGLLLILCVLFRFGAWLAVVS